MDTIAHIRNLVWNQELNEGVMRHRLHNLLCVLCIVRATYIGCLVTIVRTDDIFVTVLL